MRLQGSPKSQAGITLRDEDHSSQPPRPCLTAKEVPAPEPTGPGRMHGQ